MRRKTEAGPGGSGASGAFLLKTRPVFWPGPRLCPVRPRPPSTFVSESGPLARDSETPSPPWEYCGGRVQEEPHQAPPSLHSRTPRRPPFPALTQAPPPHPYWLRHPDTPTSPKGRPFGEAPPPSAHWPFTPHPGWRACREAPGPTRGAGGASPGLERGFQLSLCCSLLRTWLLLHSAPRSISQSSFHPQSEV